MGCERRVVYDLINVIQGEANLNQALIKDKQCDNLFVLAASQTRDKEALHRRKACARCWMTWPRWALSTSSATRRPASKPAR
jgi:hypothetical protein